MGEHHVIAVAGIVVGELPTALVAQPVRLAHRDLAAGLPVQPFIDRPSDGAEVFQQRGRLGIESCKDESAVAVHARYLRHVEFRVLEVASVAVGPRYGAQFSGIEETPAVIRALEETGRPLVLAAQRGATVSATVEQGADLAVRVTPQDDRPQTEPDRDEIIIVWDLALVPDIDPHGAKDVSHLQVEYGGVSIDQAMDAILLDELVPVVPLGPAVVAGRCHVQSFQHDVVLQSKSGPSV